MIRTRVLERKSTAEDISIGSSYWRRLTLDTQISLYIRGARHLGLDVDGVAYDVCRKPAQKPSVAKSETSEHYGQRVLEAIVKEPERYYQRRLIVRSELEMHESGIDAWHTALNILSARRLRVFPRNPDSCMQWSRECDYLSVCAGEADLRDPGMFVEEPRKHGELDTPDTLGGMELITQSSMRSFRSCQRKFQNRYELRIRPNRPKAEPLRKGTEIHRGLETYSLTGDVEKAVASLQTVEPFARAHEAAMLIGYAARWAESDWVYKSIEQEFSMPLVDPTSGEISDIFLLAGRVDGVIETSEG